MELWISSTINWMCAIQAYLQRFLLIAAQLFCCSSCVVTVHRTQSILSPGVCKQNGIKVFLLFQLDIMTSLLERLFFMIVPSSNAKNTYNFVR